MINEIDIDGGYSADWYKDAMESLMLGINY